MSIFLDEWENLEEFTVKKGTIRMSKRLYFIL